MFPKIALFLALVFAQQVDTLTAETHPVFPGINVPRAAAASPSLARPLPSMLIGAGRMTTPAPTATLRYSGIACGTNGWYGTVCDSDSCDFNSYCQGNQTFCGPGITVDTTKKVTVVTQFITDDGTAIGTLSKIRRLYVQKWSRHSKLQDQHSWPRRKTVFGNKKQFQARGGLAAMGLAAKNGMVLVLHLGRPCRQHALARLLISHHCRPLFPALPAELVPRLQATPEDAEANHPNSSDVLEHSL
ncbi:hypothetical protein DXG01_008272 [Tephrocybe rancida]|nr:hypothetical protein DXG01_008272 [Tephrocybe rancida]